MKVNGRRVADPVARYVALQRDSALTDVRALRTARMQILHALRDHDDVRAASAARAWAAYALGIARRLDEARAFEAGARASR